MVNYNFVLINLLSNPYHVFNHLLKLKEFDNMMKIIVDINEPRILIILELD